MKKIMMDLFPVLSFLNTGNSNFAMWINVSYSEIPKIIKIKYKLKNIEIRFEYDQHVFRPIIQRQATKNVIAFCYANNRIYGFDIPLVNFRDELHSLIVWLKDEQEKLNMATTKTNYMVVRMALSMYQNKLLVPAQ